MKSILKGPLKGVPTTVRFDLDQLESAKSLRINVSEVCRQALRREIKYQQNQRAMMKMSRRTKHGK